jgi:ubiquinone/menaquinone biosynthesis C-methylase UbiE
MPQSQPERHRPEVHFARGLDTHPDLSTKEVHDAYDRIHARGGMNAVPGYFDWLLSLLGDSLRGRILDVGCGTGMMLAAAAARGVATTGLDISDVAVAQARVRAPGAEFHVGVAESLPFADGEFDVVSCVGSLEHVMDPARAVREMRRVCRPGGRLLIIVPNSHYTMTPVIAIRQLLFPGLSQPVERHATRDQWQELLERSGLRVHAVHKDNNSYIPTRPLQALNRVLGRLTPLSACYQFVFVAGPDGAEELKGSRAEVDGADEDEHGRETRTGTDRP